MKIVPSVPKYRALLYEKQFYYNLKVQGMNLSLSWFRTLSSDKLWVSNYTPYAIMILLRNIIKCNKLRFMK